MRVITGRKQWLLTALLVIGSVVMVAGTFAPWLQSGQVTRNSYRTAGLLQSLLQIDGVAGAALNAMPLLALVCAVALIGFVAGLARLAAGALFVLALAMSTVAIGALSAPAQAGVEAQAQGPVITLAGSVVTIVAAVLSVTTLRADVYLEEFPRGQVGAFL